MAIGSNLSKTLEVIIDFHIWPLEVNATTATPPGMYADADQWPKQPANSPCIFRHPMGGYPPERNVSAPRRTLTKENEAMKTKQVIDAGKLNAAYLSSYQRTSGIWRNELQLTTQGGNEINVIIPEDDLRDLSTRLTDCLAGIDKTREEEIERRVAAAIEEAEELVPDNRVDGNGIRIADLEAVDDEFAL